MNPFDNIFGMFQSGVLDGMGPGSIPTPEAIAGQAVTAGVPPPMLPPVGAEPSAAMPDVGASLAPSVPLPQARPPEAGPNAAALAANAQQPGGNALLDTLRGIKAPTQPAAPKMGNNPAAPQASASAIKGGQLQALLQALQLRQGAGGGLALPPTLNSALGGR